MGYASGDAFTGLYASPFRRSSLPFGETGPQKLTEDQSRTSFLGPNQENHYRSTLGANGNAFAGPSESPSHQSSFSFGYADPQLIKAEGKPTSILSPNQGNHLGYTMHHTPAQPNPSPRR
jgi:hypothetical protein